MLFTYWEDYKNKSFFAGGYLEWCKREKNKNANISFLLESLKFQTPRLYSWITFTWYGFYMWSICQGMSLICGVFVKVWVWYAEYFVIKSVKGVPYWVGGRRGGGTSKLVHFFYGSPEAWCWIWAVIVQIYSYLWIEIVFVWLRALPWLCPCSVKFFSASYQLLILQSCYQPEIFKSILST